MVREPRWMVFIAMGVAETVGIAVLLGRVRDVRTVVDIAANAVAVAVVSIPNLVAMLCLGGVFVTLMRDELSGERAYATANTDGKRVVLRGFGATRVQDRS